jgi:hypothetical protein
MSNQHPAHQTEALGHSGHRSSDSSGSDESCLDDDEKFVQRHHRHAFIDLVIPTNSTCVGYVDVSSGVVWIAKLCGKVINQQSLRSQDGCRTLPLIEALYAAERGSLMLRFATAGTRVQNLCLSRNLTHGTVVSLQEIWAIVMNSGTALEHYVVYRTLRDHGYSLFPRVCASGALAEMQAVKAGTSTTILVFTVQASAYTLMRCISLLPGAELHSLSAERSSTSSSGHRIADKSPGISSTEASPLSKGSILVTRFACAAAVVDGADITWLGFDAFQ